MTQQKTDIAWKPILYCGGIAITGILVGTFIVAPIIEKQKAKKLAKQKAAAAAAIAARSKK